MKASLASRQTGTALTLQSLIDTRYDVLGLRSSRQVSGSDFPGQRTGIKRGQGIEFLDLRQYSQGDDVRHIDWNVTARSNEPYTRLYRQEKELTTTVLVDLRPVMFNGSKCLRAVSAGHLAAALLWQASSSGDRCSSIVIDVETIDISRPLTGTKGVLQALEVIASGFEKSTDAIDQPARRIKDAPQLSDAFTIVSTNKHHTGNTFILSGFDAGGDDKFDRALLSIAPRGRVTATLLLDAIEQQPLPGGSYRYRYGGTSNKAIIDSATRTALALKLEQQNQQRQDRLTSAGIETLSIETSCSAVQFLSELQQRGWM